MPKVKSLSSKVMTEDSVGLAEIQSAVESKGCSVEETMPSPVEILQASGEPKEKPLQNECDGARSTSRLPLCEFSFLQSQNYRTKESENGGNRESC